MSEIEIKCVQCGTQTREASHITLITTVEGREIVITRLTGTRCPTCGEEYVDATSSEKVEELIKKFRKPNVIFKRKITTSGRRRVIGYLKRSTELLEKKKLRYLA